jgi:hypothetical protein
MSSGISVLLSTHKRLGNLPRQLEAVARQSVRPDTVAVWHDGPLPAPTAGVPVIAGTHSFGVWPRFLFGLEFATEFVCVFDDDTLPGPRWLENCLASMTKHEGLIGASGFVFPHGTRENRHICGWSRPEDEMRRVDIVGHSWFFRRDWLRHFGCEPRPEGVHTAGEDYHFSVAVQKHLGLASYTAPHPAGDRSLWGSLEGRLLGSDRQALYHTPGEEEKKCAVHDFYRRGGWKLLCELGDWRKLTRPDRAAKTPAAA